MMQNNHHCCWICRDITFKAPKVKALLMGSENNVEIMWLQLTILTCYSETVILTKGHQTCRETTIYVNSTD